MFADVGLKAAFASAVIVSVAIYWSAPAAAQEPTVDEGGGATLIVQSDVRLRYEFAETEDPPNSVEALTLRMRPSIEYSPVPEVSILAEVEGILSLLPDSRNGFVSNSGRLPVADQEVLELNRLQVEFAPSDDFNLALGRQGISLDDERFIGIVDFRQNQQTYDAITASFTGPANILVRGGYIWRVGRVLGPEQPDGVFESNSFFLNAALPLSFGQFTAFHYNLDLDDRVNAPLRSETTGVSVRGRAFPGGVGLFWEASYARQNAAGAAPEYARAGVRAEAGDVELSVRFEELGSDQGVAFQTPLATLHKFQGAADIFLVTPPEGIADIEARAIWRIGSLGSARGTRISLQYNDFSSATGGLHYGQEFGVSLSTSFLSTRFTIEAAHYSADQFGRDTTRAWFTAARKF